MISEIKKKLSLLLVFVLLAALLPTAANADTHAEPEIPYFDLPCAITAIKVGLYSGSAALYGVELENPNGEGYDIGYYDFSRQFRKIAETDHCAVSIAPVSSERCYVLLEKNYESYAAAALLPRTQTACRFTATGASRSQPPHMRAKPKQRRRS